MDLELNRPSIREIQKALTSRELSTVEILEYYSHRIDQLDPRLNAFITALHPDEKTIDLGKPLTGIPIVLKDLFETKEVATTSGAEFLRNNIPSKDATVVRKLKDAGAIIIGKTNMHEVALGVTNINPHYGTCRNPWGLDHISGGSSGGSAVAVATGMCIAALGTDTGGSIRIPSSLCGTVGLKPTFGRISVHGVIPLSNNLDHVGPIANYVRDAAILLQCIAGNDPLDPYCLDHPVDDYLTHLEGDINDWKIAIAQGDFIERSQPEVISAVLNAQTVFMELGAKLEKVIIPWLPEAARANSIMTQADAATYHQERLSCSPSDFGADVLQRLRIGSTYTSMEYSQARRIQAECKWKFKNLFELYDLLILPTTPCTAPLIEGADALEQARNLTCFTSPFNLAGIPALSLPCGFSHEGLPIGLQFVGPEWQEAKVLQAGRAFERSTQWHEKIPRLNH
jgi:aspartyl-tRNA(Asn)/glutamyl-tRNA(Gln) amidotransferase subunit A